MSDRFVTVNVPLHGDLYRPPVPISVPLHPIEFVTVNGVRVPTTELMAHIGRAKTE